MKFTNREAAGYSGETLGFSFGQNWRKYLAALNEDRIDSACQSLVTFTDLPTLKGKSFMDVGCGSGLFSLAAHRLEADSIMSLDIDPFSIECARQLRLRENSPENWLIVQSSALALPLPASSFDLVYSWGVLHHTGAMWPAIEKVSQLVAPGGLFYLAIYREGRFSRQWLAIKRLYNRQPRAIKWLMQLGYAAFAIVAMLCARRNPIAEIRGYGRTKRGMSWWRDIEDWLGGLPYEYTRPEKLIQFLQERGFKCLRSPDPDSMEYLFARGELARVTGNTV